MTAACSRKESYMKKSTAVTCPGCGKHCPLGSARCKYGDKYFARLQTAESIPVPKDRAAAKRRKWERDVHPNGLLWKLLFTGRCVRKTLHKGRATEDELLAALTETERAALAGILEKIRPQCADA